MKISLRFSSLGSKRSEKILCTLSTKCFKAYTENCPSVSSPQKRHVKHLKKFFYSYPPELLLATFIIFLIILQKFIVTYIFSLLTPKRLSEKDLEVFNFS